MLPDVNVTHNPQRNQQRNQRGGRCKEEMSRRAAESENGEPSGAHGVTENARFSLDLIRKYGIRVDYPRGLWSRARRDTADTVDAKLFDNRRSRAEPGRGRGTRNAGAGAVPPMISCDSSAGRRRCDGAAASRDRSRCATVYRAISASRASCRDRSRSARTTVGMRTAKSRSA